MRLDNLLRVRVACRGLIPTRGGLIDLLLDMQPFGSRPTSGGWLG